MSLRPPKIGASSSSAFHSSAHEPPSGSRGTTVKSTAVTGNLDDPPSSATRVSWDQRTAPSRWGDIALGAAPGYRTMSRVRRSRRPPACAPGTTRETGALTCPARSPNSTVSDDPVNLDLLENQDAAIPNVASEPSWHASRRL